MPEDRCLDCGHEIYFKVDDKYWKHRADLLDANLRWYCSMKIIPKGNMPWDIIRTA